MTDTQSDLSKAGDKAGQLWGELLPVLAFVIAYNLIRITGLDWSGTVAGVDMAINADTALYWATGLLIILTVGTVVHKKLNRQPIPLFMLVSAGIVGTFGVIGIILQDKGFIYAKPTIQQGILAIIIFGSLLAGSNIWKTMFHRVFSLPDFAWNTLAFRWGLYFVAMALCNEFIWRYFAPGLDRPLSILGFQWAPAGSYAFLGLDFGVRDMENVWATYWKFGQWFITLVFAAANIPYTMKHLQEDPSGEPAEAPAP